MKASSALCQPLAAIDGNGSSLLVGDQGIEGVNWDARELLRGVGKPMAVAVWAEVAPISKSCSV